MTRKELILNKIEDLVSDFLYYDRKNDEELSTDGMEKAIKNKEITLDEVVDKFREELIKAIKDNYEIS